MYIITYTYICIRIYVHAPFGKSRENNVTDHVFSKQLINELVHVCDCVPRPAPHTHTFMHKTSQFPSAFLS